MFYSHCLVSRKGPLGAIWVAAYFFKKLKKSQVKATHIPSSVDQILQKELDALTYRVLAYLLLGVVRIYSKKVDFLFDDCNKALIGVKEFVAKERNREKTGVSLPASIECFSIALPERFELDAFDLGVLEDFHGGNVKPHEDITLKDGSQETERMDMYSMERFDMEEDLLFTFHETFSTNHNENKQ
jgi:cohesin complex subunit SCC1